MKPYLKHAAFLGVCVTLSWLVVEIALARNSQSIRRNMLAEIARGQLPLEPIDPSVSEIKHGLTFSQVIESRTDENSDGKFDSWMVIINMNSDWESTYMLSDTDFDGSPDVLSWTTKDNNAAYMLRDVPGAVEENLQFFVLGSLRDGSGSSRGYFDKNKDGLVDLITIPPDFRKLLPVGDRWYEVVDSAEGNWEAGYWIQLSSTERAHAKFNELNGKWELDDRE